MLRREKNVFALAYDVASSFLLNVSTLRWLVATISEKMELQLCFMTLDQCMIISHVDGRKMVYRMLLLKASIDLTSIMIIIF